MEILHIFADALRHAVLITGLVTVMMMMIESVNIESGGMLFKGLHKTRLGQIILSSLLGSIPGCMGGFAVVSLYTHRMVSFGALVAMMIASSGDEAFMMLAMVPKEAMILFGILFVIAVVTGYLVDIFNLKKDASECTDSTGNDIGFVVHEDKDDDKEDSHEHKRHWGWTRILLLAGLGVFIVALISGVAIHEHGNFTDKPDHLLSRLLSEDWMHVFFGILSVILLVVLCFSSDHFIEEHIWRHIIKKHLPSIFAWTFGVLAILGLLMHFVDISKWVSDNIILMIILATLVGLIPESGPHMIFVTLYASGMVPFAVLLASSISQDGHSSLPLIAESKHGYLKAKAVNCLVALIAGLLTMHLKL